MEFDRPVAYKAEELMLYNAKPSLDSHALRTTINDTIQNAANALKGVKIPQYFALGTQVQDKRSVQITSEWDGIQNYTNLEATSEYSSFTDSVCNSCGKPDDIFHVVLSRPAFGSDRPVAAPVVEFVQSYFPESRVTPEFQRGIEEDFARFDKIYKKGVKGDLGLSSGWVLEEQEHENIEDEKAKCFIIARGWESMDCFEQSVQNDAYKEAIPILFAWNAPWKMWHVERKLLTGIEVAA
ncbi:hypothetical protein V501_04807 [Pseudogymnoascus sp. VKM F-4519 (FW-2642)]|nr:hypothetical protein V501_04807 [Pseudogymnoascus sp. VKM F-4519 (FW-2642)]